MEILKRLVRVTFIVVAVIAILITAAAVAFRQPTLPRSIRNATRGLPKADPERLRTDVAFLSREGRNFRDTERLTEVLVHIEENLRAATSRVHLQGYTALDIPQANVVARFGPESGELIVVGAHYDTFGNLPGADDNASGTAGLLELARLLKGMQLSNRIELVAFSSEEPPNFGSEMMGSAVHAENLKDRGQIPAAMLCLEMIGHFTPTQPHANWLLDLSYPRHGRWIAVVGRWADRKLARAVKNGFKSSVKLPVCSFSGPTVFGGDLSDHRNYWAQGFPAVMITDTAFLRNPNYHTDRDTADTLDYDRMAQVVDGVFAALLNF